MSQNNTNYSNILKELQGLKELVKDLHKRQANLEKSLTNLTKQIGPNKFELAKSSHAIMF